MKKGITLLLGILCVCSLSACAEGSHQGHDVESTDEVSQELVEEESEDTDVGLGHDFIIKYPFIGDTILVPSVEIDRDFVIVGVVDGELVERIPVVFK
ncbi:MAG: hypothetical protein LUC31_03545 [Coprobacillus sp.]|nr:hypothetical protein [Coprobacillus sp.]